MLDYRLVEALASVILEGGFDKAAHRLNLTQSAISQRVKSLEDSVGKLLVVRSSPVRPTPEGQRIVKHYLQVAQMERDLTGSLMPAQDSEWTVLPVGVNADSLGIWFSEAVAGFLSEERVLLDISVDDQERTHLLLREGLVVGCVSNRPEPMQGCRCRTLGRMDYLCLATPSFARQWFPDGLTRQAISVAPTVMYNRKDDVHHAFLREWLGEDIRVPTHYVPHTQRFVDMVRQGLAYGMIDMIQAARPLENGELVDLAPGRTVPVRLYWHTWSLRTTMVDKLSASLAQHARQVLIQELRDDAGQ